MASGRKESLLRAFVETFPPLKLALQVNDCICFVLKSILETLWWAARSTFSLCHVIVDQIFNLILKCLILSNLVDPASAHYERLDKKREHKEPIPYRDQFLKRSLTYYGGILLGAALYLFVYFVLIKHHTFTTVAVALLLMLAYLLILENSHSIRSIIMLCLPIMFTNRGRALIFCCMLAMMVSGPLKTSQINVSELRLSLNCCKQYLIVKTDKFVDKNIVQNVVRLEEIVNKLVENIKKFAAEIKEKFKHLIELAINVERYIAAAIDRLKDIVDVCNGHSRDVYENCFKTFEFAYSDCRNKLGSRLNFVCEIVKPLKELCNIVKLPSVLCEIPKAIVAFMDRTFGERLRQYINIIESELYVDIDIEHRYSYRGTKTKSFKRIAGEIQFDMAKKFWYVHLITRVFNLLSLILVSWILITATLYHMHYLTDIEYDNAYIDGYLQEIDSRNRNKVTREDTVKSREVRQFHSEESSPSSLNEEPAIDQQVARVKILFPMTADHERKYLKPFSLWMNTTERHKFYIAGLVWIIIVGYIFFFVILDYVLYQLIELTNEILKDILFTSDLPLVDVASKTGDKVVKYNRTYLDELRSQRIASRLKRPQNSTGKSSLGSMYRRLMDSIEEDIPDDVAILDSLQQCLPKSSKPSYTTYEHLTYLAIFTFGAVVLEAYALRTRHCIANLYYPVRARKRAAWLYRKLVGEKPKYELPKEEPKKARDDLFEVGLKLLADRVRR